MFHIARCVLHVADCTLVACCMPRAGSLLHVVCAPRRPTWPQRLAPSTRRGRGRASARRTRSRPSDATSRRWATGRRVRPQWSRGKPAASVAGLVVAYARRVRRVSVRACWTDDGEAGSLDRSVGLWINQRDCLVLHIDEARVAFLAGDSRRSFGFRLVPLAPHCGDAIHRSMIVVQQCSAFACVRERDCGKMARGACSRMCTRTRKRTHEGCMRACACDAAVRCNRRSTASLHRCTVASLHATHGGMAALLRYVMLHGWLHRSVALISPADGVAGSPSGRSTPYCTSR